MCRYATVSRINETKLPFRSSGITAIRFGCYYCWFCRFFPFFSRFDQRDAENAEGKEHCGKSVNANPKCRTHTLNKIYIYVKWHTHFLCVFVMIELSQKKLPKKRTTANERIKWNEQIEATNKKTQPRNVKLKLKKKTKFDWNFVFFLSLKAFLWAQSPITLTFSIFSVGSSLSLINVAIYICDDDDACALRTYRMSIYIFNKLTILSLSQWSYFFCRHWPMHDLFLFECKWQYYVRVPCQSNRNKIQQAEIKVWSIWSERENELDSDIEFKAVRA